MVGAEAAALLASGRLGASLVARARAAAALHRAQAAAVRLDDRAHPRWNREDEA